MSNLIESSIQSSLNLDNKMVAIQSHTVQSEDIPDILSLLLPTNFSSLSIFSFSFNKRVFDGWVKQSSACCGAASVAGIKYLLLLLL
jgi:hypothetical protein